MTELYSQKYNLEKGWPTLLKNLGISVQAVLRHGELPLDLLLRKTPYVTAHEYYRFWEALAHVSKDQPALGLQLAKTISQFNTAPPIIAFLSSGNLNVALERIAHYKPVVAPVHMTVEETSQHTTLTFTGLPQYGPLPALFASFELVFWVQLARIATREHLVPFGIHSSRKLSDLGQYETFLGSSIRQDTVNKVVFTAKDAHKPFLTTNHGMWAILEPSFNKKMDDLNEEASFRERVRACLIEMLASGRYSMTNIASQLAISNRTLQRRLKQEGTTFQGVLDELREELARHYLSTTDYTSAEISFLLGYEEPNSFYRAFRAWTGQTPELIRSNK
ncbi:MAG: AraC family transcriptional regulator ligand-binding domain-containing protein [Chloroflexota bacterium]